MNLVLFSMWFFKERQLEPKDWEIFPAWIMINVMYLLGIGFLVYIERKVSGDDEKRLKRRSSYILSPEDDLKKSKVEEFIRKEIWSAESEEMREVVNLFQNFLEKALDWPEPKARQYFASWYLSDDVIKKLFADFKIRYAANRDDIFDASKDGQTVKLITLKLGA